MSYANIERADVVVVDVAIGVAFFAAGVFAIAAVIDNDDVENDDFNKTIFLMFVVYVHFLNLFQIVVDSYSRIKNTFDDFYLLNFVQKIIQSFILFFVFCFVCMRRCFRSFNFECILFDYKALRKDYL